MILEDTIIILGAGASFPYGYPTGNDLISKICIEFRESYITLMNRIRGSDYARREQIIEGSNKFIDLFRKSNLSIDHFLSINNELGWIGKAAIAFIILTAEIKSVLPWELTNHDQDWYSYLYSRMIEDLTYPDGFEKFGENKIKFITFNYDRLLEHCIFENLTSSFPNVDTPLIVKQLKQIEIFHIYGKLVDLPWESTNCFAYQHDFDFNFIEHIKDNVSIIGERKFEETIKGAKEAIRNTKNIYFLGFGYAKENLDVLQLHTILNEKHNIFGTAYKWSDKKIEYLSNLFVTMKKDSDQSIAKLRNIQFHNYNSRRLLEDWL